VARQVQQFREPIYDSLVFENVISGRSTSIPSTTNMGGFNESFSNAIEANSALRK
jgi:hypothetical protein